MSRGLGPGSAKVHKPAVEEISQPNVGVINLEIVQSFHSLKCAMNGFRNNLGAVYYKILRNGSKLDVFPQCLAQTNINDVSAEIRVFLLFEV